MRSPLLPPPAATIGLTSKGPKSPSRLADGKKKERIKPAAVALPMRCSLTLHPSDAPCRTSVFNISNTSTKPGSKKKKKKPPNITLSYSDFALQPLTSACVAAVSSHSTKKKERAQRTHLVGGGASRDGGPRRGSDFSSPSTAAPTSCTSTLSWLLSKDESNCAAVIGSAGAKVSEGGGEKPAASPSSAAVPCSFHILPSFISLLLCSGIASFVNEKKKSSFVVLDFPTQQKAGGLRGRSQHLHSV